MKPEEALTMEKLLNELQSVDTVKLVLTGCGESMYDSREVYEAIRPFVEKQIPKPIVYRTEPFGRGLRKLFYECPNCKVDVRHVVKSDYLCNYCPECGQKVRWE